MSASEPKKTFWFSPKGLFIRKALNTFRPTAKLMGVMRGGQRVRWDDAERWSDESHYKTDFYAALDETGLRLIECLCRRAMQTDTILDVCCNQGRFLLELKRRGYRHLRGFDIMEPALDALRGNAEFDPETIQVSHCLAQEFFARCPNNAFDWAITHGATIELIHPEFDIFGELSRTVRKGMCLALHEDGESYPRFYSWLHRANGFRIEMVTRFEHGLVIFESTKRRS